MADFTENSIGNNSINLARNTPVALIVGAAGFLGSNLAEALLAKKIQVIGVDNFKNGDKKNLNSLTTDKNFHFLNINGEDLKLNATRVDYIFIVTNSGWDIQNVLDIAKEFKSKIALTSTIDLYDRNIDEDLEWFKDVESRLAKFATVNKLNARVIRLSALFGFQKMHFREHDPLIRLVQASLLNELQNESTALEFSTRSLFITDATNLIIKSMFAGSTALKIFDGVGEPIKVTEVKQILLDPLWHQDRGFTPVELPPWSTPNLEKTKKELTWQPKVKLVKGLQETLEYFKDNEIKVPLLVEEKIKPKVVEKPVENPSQSVDKDWENRLGEWKKVIKDEPELNKKKSKGRDGKEIFGVLLGWGIIVFALIYPILNLAVNGISYRINMTEAVDNLKVGEFDKSLKNIDNAEGAAMNVSSFLESINLIKRTGFLNTQIDELDNLSQIAIDTTIASKKAITGTQKLYQGLRGVAGEGSVDQNIFNDAQVDLSASNDEFARITVDLKDFSKQAIIAKIISSQLNNLEEKINIYSDLSQQGRLMAVVMPQIISGNKSYLVMLVDNNNLRAGGGVITAVSRVDFKDGKLALIETKSSKDLDSKLDVPIELPDDLKGDLKKNNFFLSDSTWQPDLPTNARLAQYIYEQETTKKTNGVIYLDAKVMENLLTEIGGVEVSGQGVVKSTDVENNFDDKLLDATLRKIFLVPNLNLVGTLSVLGQSLNQKHFLVYLTDQKLLSFLVSQNLAGILPRPDVDFSDFLLTSESNIGGNSNSNIQRSFHLQTNISDKGNLSEKLQVSLVNSGTTAASSYIARFKIYLPAGAKLTSANLGEKNLLPDVTNLVDFGRQVYSMVIKIDPKSQQTLMLNYDVPNLVDLSKTYTLNIIKQAGTDSDSFVWDLTGKKRQTISTDLSVDRSFKVDF